MEHIITKENVDEAVAFMRKRVNVADGALGIVLGSGLGGLVDTIDGATCIDYAEVPHMVRQPLPCMQVVSSSERWESDRSSACRGDCTPTRETRPSRLRFPSS